MKNLFGLNNIMEEDIDKVDRKYFSTEEIRRAFKEIDLSTTHQTNDLIDKIIEFLKSNDGDKIKINLHEYGYKCSDGCCFNYGTITTLNGVDLPLHNQDTETIISQILTNLGFDVEVTSDYDCVFNSDQNN